MYNAIATILNDRTDNMKKTKKMSNSKGGGMDRTIENNILIGSSAKEVWDKEDTSSDQGEIDYVIGLNDNPTVSGKEVIRYFTGVRAADYKEEFIIEASRYQPDFINVAGIQSPGLTSAPAIAQDVCCILLNQIRRMDGREIGERSDYQPIREAPVEFRHLSVAEKAKLVEQNPAYGRVICRCETVTEGEILDAIRSPLHPRSVDAIKRRTRAGMGRCQGGFCGPRVMEILARELGVAMDELTQKGGNSWILCGETKSSAQK